MADYKVTRFLKTSTESHQTKWVCPTWPVLTAQSPSAVWHSWGSFIFFSIIICQPHSPLPSLSRISNLAFFPLPWKYLNCPTHKYDLWECIDTDVWDLIQILEAMQYINATATIQKSFYLVWSSPIDFITEMERSLHRNVSRSPPFLGKLSRSAVVFKTS